MSGLRSIPAIGLNRHPLSECWGDMSDDEWHALFLDVQENGQQDAATLLDGEVLDGWHRAQVCNALKIDLKVRDFPRDRDPISYVISKNAYRRHLTASQRAAVVLKLAEEAASKPIVDDMDAPSNVLHPDGSTNVTAVAEAAGVSRPTAHDAVTAQKAGKLDEVLSGEKSASQVAKETREPKPKKPTEIERAQLRIAELEAKVEELSKVIDELTDQLETEVDVTLDQAQQQIKFNQLREQIRSLESQLNEKTFLVNEWKSEAVALRKKLA